MKYCTDTWFLLELSRKNEKAVQILREMLEGKSRIIIPTVSILELMRSNIKTGESLAKTDAMLNELRASQKVQMISLDEAIAREAAKVSVSYDVPAIDSVIAATYKLSGCDRLLAKDEHLENLQKKKYLQIESW